MADPITGLIATTRLHLLRLDAAIAADHADAARLTPLRDDRYAQLDGAGGGVPADEPDRTRGRRTRPPRRRPPRSSCPTRRRRSSRAVRGRRGDRAGRSSPTRISTASRYRAAIYGSIAAALATPPGGARVTRTHPAAVRPTRPPGPTTRTPASSRAPRRAADRHPHVRLAPPGRAPRRSAVAGRGHRPAARAGRRAGRGLGVRARRRLQPGRRRDDRPTPAPGTCCVATPPRPGSSRAARRRRNPLPPTRFRWRVVDARDGPAAGAGHRVGRRRRVAGGHRRRPTTPSSAGSRCSACPTPPCGWPCGSRCPASCRAPCRSPGQP